MVSSYCQTENQIASLHHFLTSSFLILFFGEGSKVNVNCVKEDTVLTGFAHVPSLIVHCNSK